MDICEKRPLTDYSEEFEQIYRTYARYILCYFSCRCASKQDAEDMTQEVFLKVFLHINQVQNVTNTGSWLRAIAHNTYVSSQRSQEVQTIQYSEELVSMQRYSCENKDLLSLIEWLDVLQHILGECSMDYSIVIGTFMGYSSKEIATMLGTSSQAVRDRLCHLRKQARTAVASMK